MDRVIQKRQPFMLDGVVATSPLSCAHTQRLGKTDFTDTRPFRYFMS
jgi:hypothetical protein